MIQYKTFTKGNIDELEGLCNDLMEFQASHATIKPEVMASMNFENRLKPEFEQIKDKLMIVAYDALEPVGFAFATVTDIEPEALSDRPIWADSLQGLGFYPESYELPKKIGTFKLLYVHPNYRGLDIGKKLCELTMSYLEKSEAEDLWVYVANGNEIVGKLYEKLGFVYSHSVFNHFITAYYKSNAC